MKRKEVKPLVDIRSCKKYTCKKHDPFANSALSCTKVYTPKLYTHTHIHTPIRTDTPRYLTVICFKDCLRAVKRCGKNGRTEEEEERKR